MPGKKKPADPADAATPMMRHYLEVKQEHPDCLLFYRLGDFYELFFDDAVTASKELELALTTRDRGKPKEEQTPMCGVPHHAVQGYIAKLVSKGYKVAICDQMEDPKEAKGLVDRRVTRVVTAGTVVEEEALPGDDNNYLCALLYEEPWAGLAFCDLSTGQVEALAVETDREHTRTASEISSRRPAEVIANKKALDMEFLLLPGRNRTFTVEKSPMADFERDQAVRLIKRQFPNRWGSLSAGEGYATRAVGALLRYLQKTLCQEIVPHLTTLRYVEERGYMEMDRATRANLEITETLRTKSRKGSLLDLIDETVTPMGRRMLRSWMDRPLLSIPAINYRQEGVDAMARNMLVQRNFYFAAQEVGDFERALARLSAGSGGNARDLLTLAQSLAQVPQIMEIVKPLKADICKSMAESMDPLTDLTSEIRAAIREDGEKSLPTTTQEGGMIAPGYDAEVDRLTELVNGGANRLLEIEAREKERTGIRTLKVGYNKVFGYYIEVSNSFKDQVPLDYTRKQTLVNGERFITPELKALEQEFLTAKDQLNRREYELFTRLRDKALAAASRIQQNANAIATLDVLYGLAYASGKYGLGRPYMYDPCREFFARDMRHLPVEVSMAEGTFVPNHVRLDCGKNRCLLITGPNMAGKSTYMRAVAQAQLLAQIGSNIPAKPGAAVSVVDRIFTRIGASDDVTGGQSTFMVEMTEVAEILHNATRSSLIILDEVGRGTSTYDGMAIAQGVLEYCTQVIQAKTLFSTHYHELTKLEGVLPGVRNANMAVKKNGDELVFLRRMVYGAASRSYGIEVAQMANLPQQVIDTARKVLTEKEGDLFEDEEQELPPEALEYGLLYMPQDRKTPLERMDEAEKFGRLEAYQAAYQDYLKEQQQAEEKAQKKKKKTGEGDQ